MTARVYEFPSPLLAAIDRAIGGRVPSGVLAQALARAARLQAHGISRDAILRRVVAWAYSRNPDSAA